MKNVDPKKLVKFEKQWVAIAEDTGEIIAGNASLITLEKILKRKKQKNASLMFVPSVDRYLSP